MKWVPDRTRRFGQRPHFDPEELDYDCEQIVSSFLKEIYGAADYPITTNNLTILIERNVSDLDVYADLTTEGAGIQGVTEFFPGKKPKAADR